MEPDQPKIAVDGLESNCMCAEGLGKKDIVGVPSKDAIAHDFALLPVQRIVRLSRSARKRSRRGTEASSGTLLSDALVRTFHVVDASKRSKNPCCSTKVNPR